MATIWDEMTSTWQPAILFMLAAHLVIAGAVLARRTANREANIMLGLLLITLAGIVLRQVFLLTGLFEESAGWAFLPIANDLALAPLILGYVFILTDGKLSLPRIVLFAPAVLYSLYMSSMLAMPEGIRREWLDTGHVEIAIPMMTAFSLPATILATWFCWRRTVAYRAWLATHSSAKADFEVRGLSLALLLIAAPVAGWVITHLRVFVGGAATPEAEFPFYLLLALCGYILAHTGLSQPNIEFPRMEALPKMKRQALGDAALPAPGDGAPRPSLAADTSTEKPLDRHLGTAKLIRDQVIAGAWHMEPRLTLADVAERCGMSEVAVSHALNQGPGVNFNRFINEIRVEGVKQALEAGAEDILGLALETGFNSKATFNRVFKEITGQTPSDYRAQRLAQSAPKTGEYQSQASPR